MVLHPQRPSRTEVTQKHDNIALTELTAVTAGLIARAQNENLPQ